MTKIRLARYGSKKRPFYRIVVVDKRKKRSGAALDIIGSWDPSKSHLQVDKKKLESWLARGARKTLSVDKLLSK
ncbi:30S ribosomal protein S16 [Candidatus Woesebacteria bacterium RIFCSPHIGHO2_01_FULL_39_17]|uniref:Small ribosomal subunit protein bS16 n=2 Tax=Candidatus Woeseibacteriota TaxID=1752722 RepID=A0A0G0NFG9_9BACT|nr:MAG: 30S ribosomal protein S16 [Candidatus Woesebacteria bacterium GW2011_GWA1_39_21b]OGM23192.1 MAG: 30S ribosomal protein S16 [Candidatus Woesebacteria bacterium RIFCSPHIGHO2_01_FULL_39_17]OGM61460.1 MAG: 30S ribosomal protein S16 [Candidatus Woesebacteria bacterium RIFCSPLOWO2_01_FULL_39_14]